MPLHIYPYMQKMCRIYLKEDWEEFCKRKLDAQCYQTEKEE